MPPKLKSHPSANCLDGVSWLNVRWNYLKRRTLLEEDDSVSIRFKLLICKYKVQASESEGFGDGLKDLPPRVHKKLTNVS